MNRFAKRLVVLTAAAAVIVVAYYLYDVFRERSTTERLAEVVHLEDRREPVSKLKVYLADPIAEVRARAALAVGRTGGPGSASSLFQMLDDTSLDVASAAAFAIGLCGDSVDLMPLLDMAFDAPAAVGCRAVASAGRLADSSMTEAADGLVAFLGHPSPDVRQAACQALFDARAKTKAGDLAALVLKEQDELVRQAALYALARMRITSAGSLFIDYLADPDPFTRMICVRGVSYSGSPRTIHYLEMALNDSDPNVVAEAVTQLGGKDDDEARARLVKEVSRQKDEKLLVAAIDALRRQENGDGLPAVEELLLADPPTNVLAAAVRYLAVIKGDRAVALLDSLSQTGGPYLRAVCTESYGLVGNDNVVSRLGVLFNDQDPMVRAAAFEALTALDTASADFYIGRALSDPDRVLKVLGIGLIESSGRWQYLPELARMMLPESEADTDIRRSLVSAAGTLLKDNPEDSSARQILILGLGDPEYVVRREAALVYERLYDENRLGAIAPAETRISRRKLNRAFEKYVANPLALIETAQGRIEIELYFDTAPLTVLNFIDLAKNGFYQGLIFHRVIPGFVVQGGDPRGDGWGGPRHSIRSEYSAEPFTRGAVGMATSGKDTGGSQFFICFAPQPHLEARYTVFGQVTSGMEVVDRLVRGDVIEKITIVEE